VLAELGEEEETHDTVRVALPLSNREEPESEAAPVTLLGPLGDQRDNIGDHCSNHLLSALGKILSTDELGVDARDWREPVGQHLAVALAFAQAVGLEEGGVGQEDGLDALVEPEYAELVHTHRPPVC
jgi:hypothetical protein